LKTKSVSRHFFEIYSCLSASHSNTLFDYIDNLEGEQQFSGNTLSLAP